MLRRLYNTHYAGTRHDEYRYCYAIAIAVFGTIAIAIANFQLSKYLKYVMTGNLGFSAKGQNHPVLSESLLTI